MEFSIRTATTIISQELELEGTAARQKNSSSRFHKLSKVLRRRIIRNSIIAANVTVLVLVGLLLHYASATSAIDAQTPVFSSTASANNSTTSTGVAGGQPLDQLSSAEVAVQVADMTGVYEATSVANLADSENAQLNTAANNNQTIIKPQVIATALKSRADIVKYVTQPGDTVSSLAVKFGVTSNSIIWSNSLSGNSLTPGLTLYIPPVNGIIYTVKAGDTPASLAQEYNSNASQIIAYNNAEVSGLKTGEQIIIPNAVLASSANAGSSLGSSNSYSFGYGPVYGYNGYDYGYCTWWVAQRRAEIGEPLPANLGNASTWYPLAQEAGIPTGSVPEKGAVLWFGTSANHVAFVESVAANGDVTISEMNRVGWDIEDTRVIPAAQAAEYKYIY